MFVKKNQIYVVEISGKWILKSNTSQKIKSRSFYCPQAKLSPWLLSSPPKKETDYSFPEVKRKGYGNQLQNILL